MVKGVKHSKVSITSDSDFNKNGVRLVIRHSKLRVNIVLRQRACC